MNNAKTFLEAAIAAHLEAHKMPLVDEDFSMVFDSALEYQTNYPNATYAEAQEAGRCRVNAPCWYAAKYETQYVQMPMTAEKTTEGLYAIVSRIFEKAGIDPVEDTTAMISFDMRDPYMYMDIASHRLCIDQAGSAEIIYVYSRAEWEKVIPTPSEADAVGG